MRSEVWLYRQATQMDAKVNFVCQRRVNEDSFPAKGCQLRVLPKLVKRGRIPPLLLKLQYGWRLITRSEAIHYFSASSKEPAWWKKEFQRTSSKVTLLHYGTTAIIYSRLFKNLNQPFVIHFNGFDLSQMVLDRNYCRQIIKAAKLASGLIVVADYMRDWLLENGVESNKIHKLPYGAPDDCFTPAATKKDNSICTFLIVGRLTPKKAPLLAIKAFEKCYRLNRAVRLRIIGTGELENECKALVHNLGIDNVVTFLGPLPNVLALHEMQQASVFLQHSVTSELGDKEGWPVSIAEAASTGLPIISTCHAAIVEQVVHNKTGLLCEEGNWQKMSEHMTTLADDVTKRQKFGAASRIHMSQWKSSQQIEKLRDLMLRCSEIEN